MDIGEPSSPIKILVSPRPYLRSSRPPSRINVFKYTVLTDELSASLITISYSAPQLVHSVYNLKAEEIAAS